MDMPPDHPKEISIVDPAPSTADRDAFLFTMTPEQRELAGRRLVLGITNVGVWVLAAAGGLFWLTRSTTKTQDARWYFLIAGGALAAQSVFDFVGGTFLMPAPRPTAANFFRGWLRGVLGHTLLVAAVGALSYASFRLSGGFTPAIVLATAGQSFARRDLLRLIGSVSTTELARDGRKVLLAEATDPAFTGGIVGFGARAASLLPRSWWRGLPEEELATESIRRRWQIQRHLPARALFLVLGWNLLGAAVGSWAFRLAERRPGEALFGYACWMTLWAFGGLLALPSLSRKVVFAADRAAMDAGHDPRRWIARFPGIVGEDGGSNAAVQTIFYPVPSARRRRLALTASPAGFVPGNLARNNLYYSWSTLTLLGRAVHCNVGRPALWVFPPSA